MAFSFLLSTLFRSSRTAVVVSGDRVHGGNEKERARGRCSALDEPNESSPLYPHPSLKVTLKLLFPCRPAFCMCLARGWWGSCCWSTSCRATTGGEHAFNAAEVCLASAAAAAAVVERRHMNATGGCRGFCTGVHPVTSMSKGGAHGAGPRVWAG